MSDAGEPELRKVQGSIRGTPATRSRESANRFWILTREIENAPQGPEMKRTASRWAHTAGKPQVVDCTVPVPNPQAGARSVLTRDVGHDRRIDHLLRNAQGVGKTPPLHVR